MTQQTPWQFAWLNFKRSRSAVAGLFLLLLILLVAILAPWIAPQNPYDLRQLNILDGQLPPGSLSGSGDLIFWLGSDDQGRDILSAILYGLRISLGVGVLSAVVAMLVGTLLGLIAASAKGKTEHIIMRLVDMQLSMPSILIALIILAVLGKGVFNVVLALVIAEWATYARASRATAIVENRREYIQAARCLGLPYWRILLRHLLPNCLPALIVITTVQIARAIALEATLSFLGLGVPITQPSLGLLIANGYQHLTSGAYWSSIYPGIALVVVIVAINLTGDRLRDIFNPQEQA